MLFLVISTPRPQPPSEMKDRRKYYWDWIQPMLASGEVTAFHARVGRGGIAIFNVASNNALHQRISQWAELIPATFEIYPLVDDDAARAYLDAHQPVGSVTAAAPAKKKAGKKRK